MEFYLPQLDVSVTSSSATISGVVSQSFSGDATVAVDIPLGNARNIFQFYSDSNDITDASAQDIKYRILYNSENSSANMVFNLDTSAQVISGVMKYEDPNSPFGNVTHDYVRNLAWQLFNTHWGSDLFSNEEELRTTLRDNFSTTFHTSMSNLNGAVTDATGNSPSKTILNQIIHSSPGRLHPLNELAIEEGSQWHKCPFIAGDILNFLLTVIPAAGQHNLTGRAAESMLNRTYLIKATLRAPVQE